jgi:hypothetical protein
MAKSVYFTILCFISLVQAYRVFETNCSAPVALSNYVSSPNTRGTLNILWSSLFTIFACTWSVQHPNVPEQRDTNVPEEGDANGQRPSGFHKWIRVQQVNVSWALKGFYKTLLRMLLTVIAPEAIIGTACSERIEAKKNKNKMQKYASKDGVTWSLAHSYFANMGGFVVQNPPATDEMSHDSGYFAGKTILDYHLYHLTGEEIFELREHGYLTNLPNITEADIKDKSKSDIFGKLVALGQITWTMIQIMARAARRLPVSPLEVAVVAFAVSAVLIHGLYWDKPQRVGVTQNIELNYHSLCCDLDAIAGDGLESLRNHYRKACRISKQGCESLDSSSLDETGSATYIARLSE